MLGRQNSAKRFEVEGGRIKLRIVLMIASILLALAAFAYGINALLSRNSGWQTVEYSSNAMNCSQDFTFEYYFGAAGISASAEYKAVSAIYSTAVEEAWRIFYTDGELSAVNAAPNREVELSAALYAALEQIQAAGDRSLYLAPVYEEYANLYLCEDEQSAAIYDPARNAELAAYLPVLCDYVNDPESVNLELLGDKRVRLKLSDEYLHFAAENGVEHYLDFGWMKNAFIVDYIADKLIENGYTLGYIASFDGFTRNLDSSGRSYSLNIFDRLENAIYRPAIMEYTAPMSIVSLRNYPMSDMDRWSYFSFADGRIHSSMIEPASGLSKSATDNLIAYSPGTGCAQIALETAPLYICDTLDEAAIAKLSERGIDALWFDAQQLQHTQSELVIRATEDSAKGGYLIP